MKLTSYFFVETSVSMGDPIVTLSRDEDIFCSGVPFSWDEGRSKNGTNSSVRRPGTKRISIYLIALKKFQKK